MSRVIVVGGGLGGLATAARLAVKGHHVTVFEQSDRLGGKLHTYRRDGFAFDTGPSLFTLPAVYRDLFLKTGGPFEEAVDLQPIDPGFALHWPDGAHAIIPGVDPARAAIALGDALGGSAEADWRRLMDRAGQMWRITREPFLQSPLPDWRTLMSLAKNPNDVRTVAPFTSLRALGEQYLSDRRLVTMLDRYATYSGSDPRRAPAVFATVPYIEQTFGAWHIGGGIGTLADALRRRCEERGVTLHTNAEVARILLDDSGRACGVRLSDDSTHAADLVVANADAGVVYGQLLAGDPRADRIARGIEKNPPSVAGFVMLLAVRGRTAGIEHHNVWFPEEYDAEFDAIFGRVPRPVDDPTIYACVPSDPLMRPDAEHEPWFILINAPRQGTTPGTVDWAAPGVAEAYADHILARLAARGVDLRDRIVWRELRTPIDYMRDVRAPQGAIYGTSSNGPRAAFQRPDNRAPIPGLFLVGGSAHPGGGLPLVGMGAEITANLIGKPQ